MSEYITLLGAEDISRASSRMVFATEEFGRHIGNMELALHRHEQFMDDWLLRLEHVLVDNTALKPRLGITEQDITEQDIAETMPPKREDAHHG